MKQDREWPSHGEILFEDASLRYEKDLPLALKSVTLRVKAGSKVALTGRTGSGKSTLLSALFRLEELCGGCIQIDGRDISSLSLSLLRSKIGILPQEAHLFPGSLRFNIDPLQRHTDSEIKEVMIATGLIDLLGEDSLHNEIEREGELSAGIKQLVCLARVVLSRPHILCMDEATSHLDTVFHTRFETVLSSFLPLSTRLVIVHRLEQVADYDLVVVMEGGRVVEVGPPQELRRVETSHFARLLAQGE